MPAEASASRSTPTRYTIVAGKDFLLGSRLRSHAPRKRIPPSPSCGRTRTHRREAPRKGVTRMDIKLASTSPIAAKVGLVAVPVFEEDLDKKAEHALLAAAGAALDGKLLDVLKQERFEGKANQKLVVPTYGKLPASALVLLGLGKRSAYTHEAFRMAAGTVAREARRLQSAKIAVALPEGVDLAEAVRAGAEGLRLGAYRFDKWKTQ